MGEGASYSGRMGCIVGLVHLDRTSTSSFRNGIRMNRHIQSNKTEGRNQDEDSH
jgi:hypothetical protein